MTEDHSTNKSINLTIRFDTQRLEELRKLASEKGMGVTTLVRMWVLERLEQERFREYAKQETT
jgi:predicted DNA binding CopG/RHH family protein